MIVVVIHFRCLSNSVIPLIPQYNSLQPDQTTVTPEEESKLGFGDWLEGMMLATKYVKEVPPPTKADQSENQSEQPTDGDDDDDEAVNRQLFYTCPLAQVGFHWTQ